MSPVERNVKQKAKVAMKKREGGGRCERREKRKQSTAERFSSTDVNVDKQVSISRPSQYIFPSLLIISSAGNHINHWSAYQASVIVSAITPGGSPSKRAKERRNVNEP
jgi:hypothetical protein